MFEIDIVEKLVLQSQLGQQSAFEELFALYQPRLRYYLRRLNNSDHRQEDIAQEIWLKVYRKIDKLKEPRAFGVWLYKIARNEFYEHLRKKDIVIEIPFDEIHTEPIDDQSEFPIEKAQQIHHALSRIKPHFREVLTLFFIEQMSYEQIAEVIGCNTGTVRSRMYYAKQALKKEMERDHD